MLGHHHRAATDAAALVPVGMLLVVLVLNDGPSVGQVIELSAVSALAHGLVSFFGRPVRPGRCHSSPPASSTSTASATLIAFASAYSRISAMRAALIGGR